MTIPFQTQMNEYFSALIGNRELTDQRRERLSYIIEGMTNIDTDAKLKVFLDLVSCDPKLDYNEIAKLLDKNENQTSS